MTALIVRIEADWLRVPCWVFWWPLRVVDCCVGAIASGDWRRLLAGGFWAFQMEMLAMGIEGL